MAYEIVRTFDDVLWISSDHTGVVTYWRSLDNGETWEQV